MKQETGYMLSDEAIVELYWARDEAAIKHTDIKYRSYLLKTAYNILQDMQDSEECLNDTYLDTWNAIPPERPRVLQAFIGRITRNLAIDRYRAKHRKKAVPPCFIASLEDLQGWALEDDDYASKQEAQILADVISAWLRTLSERKRYVFFARYYDAQTTQDIAQVLGVARSTVNADIAFIKTSLKQALQKEGYTV
jgi:RNA polymerase sigma-70 factor (ECF subfamily)